jgi:hypothetical protein
MDAAAREAQVQGSLEWRVTVPEGSSVTVEHEAGFARKVWKIGADDPRRAVHSLKVGLALTLVSIVYYTRPVYDGVGGNAMWAVMTVVVVFEYTVGE